MPGWQKFLKSNPKLKSFSKGSCRISDGQGVESWYWQEVRSVYFSPETFLAVESVVWIVIEKSSDAPYYCHPAETESFRKRSESHPPTITGLTLPDPRITAPPQSRTFLAHYLKKSTAHFVDGGGWRVDAALVRGWGININTTTHNALRRQLAMMATDVGDTEDWAASQTFSTWSTLESLRSSLVFVEWLQTDN